jgi:8-oxo-dGTP pyrophosphatase MutT (NUDIX family)
VTEVRVSAVDVYPLRVVTGGLEVLLLRRGPKGPRPHSWEAVHGHIDADDPSPAHAALRELAEETGLPAERLYNLSRVEMFYRHKENAVQLIPAFAAFTAPAIPVRLSDEHEAHEWLPLEVARARVAWPRSARALGDAGRLLAGGTAGELEDVLRVW